MDLGSSEMSADDLEKSLSDEATFAGAAGLHPMANPAAGS